MGRVEEIAHWAAELEPGDLPEDVTELCRAQRRSVLAAVAASVRDSATRRVLDAVDAWGGEGPAPLLLGHRTASVEDALFAACACSISLDFDDYCCFGHTGHSAVLVPLLLSAETQSSVLEQIVAQVIANEVGARLGGACLLGPLNGQLWSFLHAASAALAAGRLLGLEGERLGHALAIALTDSPRPTVPGFMAPDSKLLTAADPSVAGLRAARLAAAGVTGPLDVLDHPQGFLDAFSFAPLPGMLDGLGEAWATRTLTIKPYPGCAYLDTTVDALLEIGPFTGIDEIERVTVVAGLLTCGMDAMSSRYASIDPTPVTVNFSVPWNVAIVALAGRLTAEEVSSDWLTSHRDELAELASRVRLRHDWSCTSATARAFGPVVPARAVVADVGIRRLITALGRLRSQHRPIVFTRADVLTLLRQRGDGLGRAMAGARFLSSEAIGGFQMTFPARVEVQLRDGSVRRAAASQPRGGAGNPICGPADVAREKFAGCAPLLWGAQGTRAIDRAISDDDPRLLTLLSHARI
ncbi:MAG: hypothetical protein JJLCMIEE_00265 [Acidimicrobiales bacterium]|nr:hypothetical protein [Acidimicrobiales bacterium]